jgi:LysM repeat protein
LGATRLTWTLLAMRVRILLPIMAAGMLVVPTAAQADFAHVITPGESLYSVAAADGLSVAQLAAANGISPDTQLVSGTTLMIPPQGASAGVSAPAPSSASAATSSTTSTALGDGDADSDESGAVNSTPVSTSSSSGGSYVVQPGDTLTAIAARAGISVAQLAAANGIDPNAPLLSGTALQLSGSGSSPTFVSTTTSSSSVGASEPVGAAAQGNPSNPPYPTPERVSASEVGQIASANGVPAALAQAVGWQESGFNNDLVSAADARGVMQILPGTWDWINRTLTAGQPLAPASAASNVRGGVLLLHSLLNATGGDPAMAAAGYYQGLSSVQQHGMYSDTQQYVNNVLSLERQFGGG